MHNCQTVDLNLGMSLYTRDGRRTGNGRIMSESQDPDLCHAVFGITTEAGQKLILSEREVDALFFRTADELPHHSP